MMIIAAYSSPFIIPDKKDSFLPMLYFIKKEAAETTSLFYLIICVAES